MNLFAEAGAFLHWMTRIGQVFLRARPVATLAVVGASALSMGMSILSLVLPLKVIALVATEGVSGWFKPLVGAGGKEVLVWGLTAAAVASFFVSIGLDASAKRLAASISRTVLRGSNDLAVIGDQGARAESIFSQFSSIVAGLLFALAGLAAIALVNPVLVGILASAFVLELTLTAAVLRRGDPLKPGFLASFVTRDVYYYLKILSSLTFLLAFAVLLYPFVWGTGGSVIAALLSVIVLRRVLSTMVQFLGRAMSMVRQKPMIDALFFRERQYQQVEGQEMRTLRDVFHKQARQRGAAEILRSVDVGADELEVRWHDSRLPGLSLLTIHSKTAKGAEAYYQQQIYLPKHDHRLDNEAVLFSHLAREQLCAPRVFARFSEGSFQCQICAAGTGACPPRKDWARIEASLNERLMAVPAPAALIRAFKASHPVLSERLSDRVVARLGVAVDTAQEATTFKVFCRLAYFVRDCLDKLPHYVYNPEIMLANVFVDDRGEPLVMTWGKWSVEPIGGGLAVNTSQQTLEAFARGIRDRRSSVYSHIGADHLRFALLCWHIERNISANLLKNALGLVHNLLEHPFVVGLKNEQATMLQSVGGM